MSKLSGRLVSKNLQRYFLSDFFAVLIQSIGLKVEHINGRKKAGICSMIIGKTVIRNICYIFIHVNGLKVDPVSV